MDKLGCSVNITCRGLHVAVLDDGACSLRPDESAAELGVDYLLVAQRFERPLGW